MKKYIAKPAIWVAQNKFRSIIGKPIKLIDSVQQRLDDNASD